MLIKFTSICEKLKSKTTAIGEEHVTCRGPRLDYSQGRTKLLRETIRALIILMGIGGSKTYFFPWHQSLSTNTLSSNLASLRDCSLFHPKRERERGGLRILVVSL